MALSTRNGKFVPGLEAQAGVNARRDERAMPERIVSEEQQRDGPGMGFPEGPGAFELRLCRASLTYRCGYARSALRGSLRIRSGKPGTNLPFSVLSPGMGFFVDLFEVFGRHMSIGLGRDQVPVTQHLLNGLEVAPPV